MVTVTEHAKEELGRTLSSANVEDPELGLRLMFRAPGEFGLVLDKEKEGDHVVEHEGSKVLLVGEEISGLVGTVTIDCEETTQGSRLVIRREPPSAPS